MRKNHRISIIKKKQRYLVVDKYKNYGQEIQLNKIQPKIPSKKNVTKGKIVELFECFICKEDKKPDTTNFISCRCKGIILNLTRREHSVSYICTPCLNHPKLSSNCPICRSHTLGLAKKRFPTKKKPFLERETIRKLKLQKKKDTEILQYAQSNLGMDPNYDKRYLYIAEEAMTCPLPIGWYKCDFDGNRTIDYSSWKGTYSRENSNIIITHKPTDNFYIRQFISKVLLFRGRLSKRRLKNIARIQLIYRQYLCGVHTEFIRIHNTL